MQKKTFVINFYPSDKALFVLSIGLEEVTAEKIQVFRLK